MVLAVWHQLGEGENRSGYRGQVSDTLSVGLKFDHAETSKGRHGHEIPYVCSYPYWGADIA